MRPRVLAIGDSLSIPRASSAYEDTWLYRLKALHPAWDIVTLCEGGRTTDCLTMERAATGGACLSLYRPDIVILQLGIVDCAPRLFSERSIAQKILRRCPEGISRPIIEWLKKTRGRRSEYALVPPDRFRRNLEYYFEKCAENNVKKVIMVSIAHPDRRMIDKNQSIVSAIAIYNDVYERMAEKYRFVRVVHPINERTTGAHLYEDDGYHFNRSAHELVLNTLEEAISGISND